MILSPHIGALLRDRGMESVLENSGDWSELAGNCIDDLFDYMPSGEEFIGQAFRLAISDSIPEPHHPNAWSAAIGSRVRQWVKAGRIVEVGWQAGIDPRSHARRCVKYRKL